MTKRRRPLWIFLAALLVLVIVLGIWIGKKEISSSQKDTTSGPSFPSNTVPAPTTEPPSLIPSTTEETTADSNGRLLFYQEKKEFSLNEKDSLKINMSVGTLKIKPTDQKTPYLDYRIYTSRSQKTNYRLSLDREEQLWTISVTEPEKHINDQRAYLDVYVPTARFQSLSIQGNVLELDIEDVSVRKFRCRYEVGSAKYCHLVADQGYFSWKMGSSSFYKGSEIAENLTIKITGAGKGTFMMPKEKGFSMDYESAIGNITKKFPTDSENPANKVWGENGHVLYLDGGKLHLDVNVQIGDLTIGVE